MSKRAAELVGPGRVSSKEMATASGCWIHCYPDLDRGGQHFIVRESFESGALALSANVTEAESETERVLVAAGADPGEAHARVQEAITRGTAFLTFR